MIWPHAYPALSICISSIFQGIIKSPGDLSPASRTIAPGSLAKDKEVELGVER